MGRALRGGFLVVTLGLSWIAACSSSSGSDDGIDNPPRDDAGVDAPVTETSTALDCTKRQGKVSDQPACDTCAKAKCCEQITACDKDPQCQQVEECLQSCDDSDPTCGLTCAAVGGSGTDLLQAVGACAMQRCKTECPSSTPDSGGFDGAF